MSTPLQSPVAELTPCQIAPVLHTYTLIDVREPHEFHGDLGHVAGSRLLPIATIGSAAATLDRDRPLLVICRSGRRAHAATALLASRGFDAVNLTGGMLAWSRAGLPMCGAHHHDGACVLERLAC